MKATPADCGLECDAGTFTIKRTAKGYLLRTTDLRVDDPSAHDNEDGEVMPDTWLNLPADVYLMHPCTKR